MSGKVRRDKESHALKPTLGVSAAQKEDRLEVQIVPVFEHAQDNHLLPLRRMF